MLKKPKRVILIREKLSRLSQKVTLENSIIMELGFQEATPGIVSKTLKTKVVELKTQMVPSNLAE